MSNRPFSQQHIETWWSMKLKTEATFTHNAHAIACADGTNERSLMALFLVSLWKANLYED